MSRTSEIMTGFGRDGGDPGSEREEWGFMMTGGVVVERQYRDEVDCLKTGIKLEEADEEARERTGISGKTKVKESVEEGLDWRDSEDIMCGAQCDK